MFEKEAEEYANEYGQDAFTQFNMPQWIEPIRMERKLGFQKGAEYGYNKANEWHKQEVDDIYDLISEDWSIRYFICIMKDGSRVPAIGNCDEGNNGNVSVNLFFEYDDEKYYMDDIVWWKEIVLPKENLK
jgi:hypothetical protein